MSWPATHSLLNHFPIALVIVGALVLLAAIVRPVRGAWLYALGSFILAAIGIYPAWITGESAARFVSGAWYIAPGAVHRHAEMADITLWIVLALGLVSLIAWLSIVRAANAISPAGWLRTVVALLAIASIASIAVTTYFGEKVVIESPILMKPVPPLAIPIPADTTPATTPTTPATTPTQGQVTAPGSAPGGAIVPAPTQSTTPAQQRTQPSPAPASTPGTTPGTAPVGTSAAPATH